MMIHVDEQIREGMPLSEAIALTVPAHILKQPGIVVLNHGVEILDPEHYYIRPGDRLIVGRLPQGGGGEDGAQNKSIGSIIIGIVLIVVGAYTYNPNLVVMGAGLLLGGISGLMVKAPTVGTVPPTANTSRDSSYYGITGQSNSPRPYQSVLKVYGRYKMFPALAANPIITNIGVDSTISAIYDFGIGNVLVESLAIGDTPVGQFEPELRLHTNVKDMQPELANRRVSYDQFSYVLQRDETLILNTDVNTWHADIDLLFTQGLVFYDKQGNPNAANADFQILWRKLGATDWVDVTPSQIVGMPAGIIADIIGTDYVYEPTEGWITETTEYDDASNVNRFDSYTWFGEFFGTGSSNTPLFVTGTYHGIVNPVLRRGAETSQFTYAMEVGHEITLYDTRPGIRIRDASTRPKVASVQIQFPEAGQYEISITRKNNISADTRLFDSATLTMLKSTQAGDMFALSAPHTMLEMRLLASDKLSGVVQNLSAIVTSVLPTYDANGAFVVEVATRNPAWIAVDVLTGSANPKPLPLGLMDWPSWVALAAFCDEQREWNINGQSVTDARHTCDVVIDYTATVKEIIESILSCCRATLVLSQAGKYGAMIDRQNITPRQLITTNNSWDFSGSRTFSEKVHGLRVAFVDNARQYQRQEIFVYRDGYGPQNATKFEQLGTFGITDWFRAWAFGRFMMAQVVYRAETFSVTMDIENLAVQRGDLVYVQHDVPKLGGFSTRVVSVTGDQVLIGQALSTVPDAYTVRLQDGSIRQGTVDAVIDSYTFQLDDASGIGADDLIVLGFVDTVTRPYLINAINPMADLTAQLMLSVYEPLIYDADIGALPVYDPAWGDDLINGTNLAVTSVTPTTSVTYINRSPIEVVDIDFTVNSPLYAYAQVFLDWPNQRPELIGTTDTLHEQHTFSLIASREKAAGSLTFRVVPFTAGGIQGQSMSATVAVLENPPPSAPATFDLDVKRETINLLWTHPDDADVVAYAVWYDPRFVGASLSGATRLAPSIPWPSRTFEVPLRLGTYFIQSIDSAGQVSPDFGVAFTPTDTLWNLNVIAVWDDDPTWPGLRVEFDYSASVGGLVSRKQGDGAYPQRSEYYYAATYDGGDLYQTRLTSKIVAGVFNANSFMASWTPLAEADPLQGWALDTAGNRTDIAGAVDVYHEVRWIDTEGVMSSWLTLASVNPIGYGTSDQGVWRRFQVGEFVGRVFQFRLVAEYIGGNLRPDVGVEIGGAIIEVDMPDRTDGQYNIVCPVGGIRIAYDPPFKARPVLSITPDIVSTGDYYTITLADETGFTIKFFNPSNASVARNFDWLAKGYGARSLQNVTGLYDARIPRRHVVRPVPI